jgi:hypothetical protein
MNPSRVPSSLDGTLLQNMPWPFFRNMSDHGIAAIYEYVSAIPCVAGEPTIVPRWIINVCP